MDRYNYSMIITSTYLNEILHYDPLTGALSNKIDRGKAKKGFVHHSRNTSGRIIVTLHNKTYIAHRVIWCMMTGLWPEEQIDHKDGDHLNNRWDNLREATLRQNLANRRMFRTKKLSSTKGVYKAGKRYKAVITYHGEHLYLGRYDTEEEAGEAYMEAAEILWEEFARAA